MTDSILRSYQYYTTTTMVPYPAATPLFLDAYPSATLAYSFRKLRAAYAGSAVRIRRSSDNAEQDVGFSGDDFDSATAASFIGGGNGFIVTWYDQSGNGYNATQSSSGSQPKYVASGINSKPSANFDTTTFALATAGATGVAFSAAAASASIVVRYSTGSVDASRLLTWTTAAAHDYQAPGGIFYYLNAGTLTVYRDGFLDATAALSNGVVYAFQSIFSGSTHKIYTNGSAGSGVAYSVAIGDAGGVKFFVGGNTDSADPVEDYYSELIVWPSNQTANVSGIDANVSSYYGV